MQCSPLYLASPPNLVRICKIKNRHRRLKHSMELQQPLPLTQKNTPYRWEDFFFPRHNHDGHPSHFLAGLNYGPWCNRDPSTLPMMTQAPSAHQQEGESHVPFVGNASLAHRSRFFFFFSSDRLPYWAWEKRNSLSGLLFPSNILEVLSFVNKETYY